VLCTNTVIAFAYASGIYTAGDQQQLDVSIGDVVEIDGRGYDVVSDKASPPTS
jgi:hypothetical protein